ncbi:Uncharacterized membrane protein YkvA, DUF1232 family [Limimonas halophila]|uniref:Uncharacterized membrane protein YkvA, DUF1232 family n=1 Tax=Limimonas halophila TaxID=1082479 RepID=A0A1G7T3B4_9PROT|nr:hypothetical protein [Limimonas halophila]SDG29783.1 Uncharacterized membrane protein YkvA, DUF1232 family [Limimonas halophila]
MFRLPDWSVDRERYARDAETVEHGFWARVREHLGGTARLEDGVTLYYCAVDPRTPLKVKALLMAALAAFVTPARGPVRVLGSLAGLNASALFAKALAAARAHVRDEHRERARAALARLRASSSKESSSEEPS